MPSRSIFGTRKARYILAASILAIAISIALYNAAENGSYKNSKTWNFDSYQDNIVPDGFESVQLGSVQGSWIIKSDNSSPSKPNVLAKLSNNNTDSFYHIQLMPEGITTSESLTSVKFKIISGEKERAAGLVVRFQGSSHYFVLIADAVNSRFSLCKAEPDRLICRYDRSVTITTGEWHTISAQVSKMGIAGSLDDKLLIKANDAYYQLGQPGVWTKGDSQVYFDDLKIDY